MGRGPPESAEAAASPLELAAAAHIRVAERSAAAEQRARELARAKEQLEKEIAERGQAEAALDQERYLLNALMDHIPDSIYSKDTGSRFLRINKALANRFGLSAPAEALGKTDFDYFTEEHARPALLPP